MAQANVPGTVRPRVFTVPEGGTEEAPPEQPTQGTVPAGPSGTPIVTVGGGIEGTVTPPVVPVSPAVPIPPAPPSGEVQGPPPPPPAEVVVESPPPAPGEPGFIGPLDWWLSMDITSRAQLENLIQEMSDTIRNLNNQLSAANGRIAQLESAPPNKGEKGDKGDPGVDGKDGVDGRNGKDGINGRDATPFTMTPEYVDLVQSASSAQQRAIAANTRADNAMSIALTARSENAQTRSLLTGIAANPNLVSVPPSASQIAEAVQNYLSSNPPSRGIQGPPGTPATPQQVQAAVETWMRNNPVVGVTPTQITTAVNDYLRLHPPTVTGGGVVSGGTTTVVENPYVLTYDAVLGVLGSKSGDFINFLTDAYVNTQILTGDQTDITALVAEFA